MDISHGSGSADQRIEQRALSFLMRRGSQAKSRNFETRLNATYNYELRSVG